MRLRRTWSELEVGMGEEFDVEGVPVRVLSIDNENLIVLVGSTPKLLQGTFTGESTRIVTNRPREGTLRAFVHDYLRSRGGGVFTRQELDDWVRQYKPNLNEGSLQAELSYAKKRGEIEQVGTGEYRSLVFPASPVGDNGTNPPATSPVDTEPDLEGYDSPPPPEDTDEFADPFAED